MDDKRLIDANAVTEELNGLVRAAALIGNIPFQTGVLNAIAEIKKAETIEAEPVVKAYWEPLPHLDDTQKYYCRCSRCGRAVSRYHGTDINKDCPYCNCGARMNKKPYPLAEDDLKCPSGLTEEF